MNYPIDGEYSRKFIFVSAQLNNNWHNVRLFYIEHFAHFGIVTRILDIFKFIKFRIQMKFTFIYINAQIYSRPMYKLISAFYYGVSLIFHFGVRQFTLVQN